ncbi:Cysteine proteinase inhibitor 12 [Spatholobus suberectus]|nr:Cysteine proteinase inhibitor 12 [Spatholobus suberectus]
MVGITDVPGAANSVEIEKLARFAVDEYNKKENAALEFVKVISAKKQDVSGVLYYITLEAKMVGRKRKLDVVSTPLALIIDGTILVCMLDNELEEEVRAIKS